MCLAVPGQVESIRDDNGTRMGRVNFGGVVKDVCLAYLPEIAVGDYTIVHVGFAISKIDEASARETLRTFEELGILAEGLAELREPLPEGGERLGFGGEDTPTRLAFPRPPASPS
jgi:hydrogenase expression/formation protein HypC